MRISKESMEFVKKIGFSRVHIFPYSVRKGTVAANRSGHLPKHLKNKRAAQMNDLCKKQADKFLQNMIGKTQEVLFEKEKSNDFHQGYTRNYTLVKVPRISRRNQFKTKNI